MLNNNNANATATASAFANANVISQSFGNTNFNVDANACLLSLCQIQTVRYNPSSGRHAYMVAARRRRAGSLG